MLRSVNPVKISNKILTTRKNFLKLLNIKMKKINIMTGQTILNMKKN